MTKFAIEAFRNAVWYGCGLALHPPLLPKPAAFLHPRNLVAALPRCVLQRPLRATDTVWLALVLLFVVAALPRCDLPFPFGLELQHRIKADSPLIAAGILLKWLKSVGQRSIITDFRPDEQAGNRFGHRRLYCDPSGDCEVSGFSST